MNALLTIVVPIHNREHLVLRTLDSIAASSSWQFRLLLVDNASTDHSRDVCSRWAEERRNEGLEVDLLTESTPGAPAARNCGLEACETPWVYFFDSDDCFDQNFIESVITYLYKSELDMLCFPTQQEADGHVTTRAYLPVADAATHLVNSMLSTQSMLFRTAWLRGIGGWDERLGIWQDWELGLRALLARPRLRWLTGQAFHRIQVHPDSITGSSFSTSLPAIRTSLEAALEDIRNATDLAPAEHTRLLRAMNFRIHIMAGKFAREGSGAGRQLCRSMAADLAGELGGHSRLCARLLETYTACGGRGAWRVVQWIINRDRK